MVEERHVAYTTMEDTLLVLVALFSADVEHHVVVIVCLIQVGYNAVFSKAGIAINGLDTDGRITHSDDPV